jgi:hypothetical protein
MTSSNGVVIKRSPRQHGFITTMACGLRRVRGRKNREILLSSANGMRNIEQSMVIMRCRSVFSFNQVAINCLEMPRPGTQIYCTRIPAFQDYLIHQFTKQRNCSSLDGARLLLAIFFHSPLLSSCHEYWPLTRNKQSHKIVRLLVPGW